MITSPLPDASSETVRTLVVLHQIHSLKEIFHPVRRNSLLYLRFPPRSFIFYISTLYQLPTDGTHASVFFLFFTSLGALPPSSLSLSLPARGPAAHTWRRALAMAPPSRPLLPSPPAREWPPPSPAHPSRPLLFRRRSAELPPPPCNTPGVNHL